MPAIGILVSSAGNFNIIHHSGPHEVVASIARLFFTPSPFLLSSVFLPLLAHCRLSVQAYLSLFSVVILELGTLEQLRVDPQLLAFGRFYVAEVFLRARAVLPLCCVARLRCRPWMEHEGIVDDPQLAAYGNFAAWTSVFVDDRNVDTSDFELRGCYWSWLHAELFVIMSV